MSYPRNSFGALYIVVPSTHTSPKAHCKTLREARGEASRYSEATGRAFSIHRAGRSADELGSVVAEYLNGRPVT